MNSFGINMQTSESACVDSCTPSKVGVAGVGIATACCSTDLCNTATAQTVSLLVLFAASIVALVKLQ